jgi:hypothetical protein
LDAYRGDVVQGQDSGAVLAEFAMEVAPVVDRIRMSMMQAAFSTGPPSSFRAAGLDEAASGLLAYLRNAYPDRVVTRTGVRSVFSYQPAKPVGLGIDALVESGVLVEPLSGDLMLTAAGQRCLEDLHAVADAAAVRAWAHSGQSVATAGPLVERALDAAWDSGGEAFAVMAPVHLPEGMSEAGVLAERLTGLRFHRFDAHIAAWSTAGYSFSNLDSLSVHERAALEAETNARAAGPYAVLSPSEREQLLAALVDLAK